MSSPRIALAVTTGLIALALVLPVGAASTPRASPADMAGSWSNLTSGRSPPAAAGTMMAYDSAADRFVWFGGWNGSLPLNETWELDAATGAWTRLAPPIAPLARADAAFVYDANDQLFYLFGGWSQYPNGTVYRLNDTWSFSLALDRWDRISPSVAPSPRSDAAVGFDSSDDRLVLFGGFSGTEYLGDAWSFSPTTANWQPLPATSPEPSPRADGRMTYLPTTNSFVLFGGNNFSGPDLTFHHLDDTWSFSYPSRSWTEISTTRAPTARDYAVQALDPATDWVLLYGGYGNRTILGDCWAFSTTNQTWWLISSGGVSTPPGRYAGAGGFDASSQRFVIFGGLGGTGLLNDTWTLDLAQTPPGSPAAFPWVWVAATGVAVGAAATVWAVWTRRSRS
jgi:hypothetical protein